MRLRRRWLLPSPLRRRVVPAADRLRALQSRARRPRAGPAVAEQGRRLRRRGRELAGAGAILALLPFPATLAAFTVTTSVAGTTITAGSVTLTDNDSGDTLKMFNLSGLSPGAGSTSCIQVKNAGSLPATVKLFGVTAGTGLDAYLTLTVTRGTISSGAFGACAAFTPDPTDYSGLGAGVLFDGTLNTFPGSYSGGLVDPHTATVPEVWTKDEVHSYKFQITLQNNASAQGETASPTFTWQAANTLAYSQVVLSDGPSSYWPLDETSGTAAIDTKGAANGTYANGPSLNQISGVLAAGRAVSFDGVDDYLTLGDAYRFSGTSAFSVECWMKPTSPDSRSRRVVSKESASSGWDLFLAPSGGTSPNTVNLTRRDAGGADTAVGTTSLQPGTWHHVVATYDGATIKVYVDGALEGTAASTRSNPGGAEPLVVGNASYLTDGYHGTLDEVAVYGYALSQQQVTEHYLAGAS